MHKSVSILAIAGSIAFLGAGAAQAYIAPPAPGTVSDSSIAAGETVVFSGTGFTPGEQINITVDFTAGDPAAAGAGAGRVGAVRTGVIVLNQIIGTYTTTAAADGSFAFPVTLEEEGTYTLTARGVDSGNTVVSVVTVAEAAPVAGGTGDSDGGTTGGTTGGTAGGTTGGTTKGGLANTGVDSAMVLWGAAGIGALGLGAGSIVVARRRTGAEA